MSNERLVALRASHIMFGDPTIKIGVSEHRDQFRQYPLQTQVLKESESIKSELRKTHFQFDLSKGTNLNISTNHSDYQDHSSTIRLCASHKLSQVSRGSNICLGLECQSVNISESHDKFSAKPVCKPLSSHVERGSIVLGTDSTTYESSAYFALAESSKGAVLVRQGFEGEARSRALGKSSIDLGGSGDSVLSTTYRDAMLRYNVRPSKLEAERAKDLRCSHITLSQEFS